MRNKRDANRNKAVKMKFLVLLFFAFVAAYCILCPYTKVEESFNLQAIHDILHFGTTDVSKYDHLEFPGVVPRTFLGAIAVATCTFPVLKLLELVIAVDTLTEQVVSRLVLGAFVMLSLARFQAAVKALFGQRAASVFILLLCCQFHLAFWSSRTLPNTFALPLVINGLAHWMESHQSLPASSRSKHHLASMIRYLTVAGIIFRFEAGILLVVLLAFEYRTLSIKTIMLQGLLAGVPSLTLTVLVDSYFWQKFWLWPEGVVFYFNAILNKSSEWGTMPFYAYFVVFLPRLLMLSYPLSIVGFCSNARIRRLLAPSFAYIILFSMLPHKEWRFIVYTIPVFTAAASATIEELRLRSTQRTLYQSALSLVYHGMLLSLIGSLLLFYISVHNYPGGHALHKLHMLENPRQPVSVHLDTATAMTGASRFGQLYPTWTYHKDESLAQPDDYLEREYTHLITESPEIHIASGFEIIDTTRGLDKIQIKRPKQYLNDLLAWLKQSYEQPLNIDLLLPIRITTRPALWTMKLAEPQETWITFLVRKHPVVMFSKTYWYVLLVQIV